MRMTLDAIAIKRRHRIASIIETKPGDLWQEPEVEEKSHKSSPPSPSARRSNRTTVVDFHLEETPPKSPLGSGTRLSVVRPTFPLQEEDEESIDEGSEVRVIAFQEGLFATGFRGGAEPSEHPNLFDDSYDDLSTLYMEDRVEPFSYAPSLVFFLVERYGVEEMGTLPLTWSGLCLKMAALFNEIQLAVLHNHVYRYFSLIHSVVSLTTRLLMLLPHTPQDGQVLLPRAREVVDTISRLVVELFEASGTWASGEDSLSDARFGDVSVATSLLAVRDFLQTAQYHAQPFNRGVHPRTPYPPLLVELQRMASLSDYKYILRLDFLSKRIGEASQNLLLVLSCGGPHSDRPSSTPGHDQTDENSPAILGLLDAIKFYVTSVGHFLSLVRWVLMVPKEGVVSPTSILLRHLLGTVDDLQQWAKLCLHTLTPTAITRITQFGLSRTPLDLSPWIEAVELSQTCFDNLILLSKDLRHLEGLPNILPTLPALAGNPSCEDACPIGASAVHRVLVNACVVRELRHDTEATMEKMKGPTPSTAPAFGPRLREGTGLVSVIYHNDGSGRVKLATWDGLVELLAPKDRVVDSAFLRVFFLSFRAFATPHQLFYALTDKFDTTPCGRPVPVNIRISNALLSWLELYYFEDDYHVVPLIKEFSTSQLSASVPAAGQRLAEVSLRLLDNHFSRTSLGRSSSKFKYQCLSLADPVLSPTSSSSRRPAGFAKAPGVFGFRMGGPTGGPISSNPISPLLEWGPAVLASSLTLLDAELFCNIQPQHIISYVLSKGKFPAPADCPVKRLVDWSNQVNRWVVETVLWEEDYKQRVSILKAFVNLTERLIAVNNFNMAMAILSGLNASAVSRLHSTWGGLPSKTRATLVSHNHLFDPHRNFAAYRTRLRSIPSSTEPCVPFFGITLTDITFLLQGNPTYRSLSSLKSALSQDPALPSPSTSGSLRLPKAKGSRQSHTRHHSEGVASAPHLSKRTSQLLASWKQPGPNTPWEPLPEVEFINFDKFYRLVQVLDNLEERQAVSYSFPHLENPHTTAQILKDHIYNRPTTPAQASPKPASPADPSLAPMESPSLDDILVSTYETYQQPSPTYLTLPTAMSRQARTPPPGSPSATFNLTMEDYYQRSLRLEPPNRPL
ncbi:Ras guanine nucleotide exchange factor bud5 [Massospora cicadina]|nr:Ras guanine nucleotide exchange factor bud5 [Massospora cicadina]